MSFLSSPRALASALVPLLLAAALAPALQRWVTVLGVLRHPQPAALAAADHLVVIDDTTHCEDLHYYAPAHTLFAACEDDPATRYVWFPPLATFQDPVAGQAARGSIHVIDPETKTSRRLTLAHFDGPFVTHGIDVIPDPKAPDAVYLFAINHVPSAEYLAAKQQQQNTDDSSRSSEADKNIPVKADSRVEIFRHVLGSSTARHVRTVRHPLVRTPNDVVATSPSAFYVTNDHRYREGLLRQLEDVYFAARWTDVVHVRLAADGSVDAAVALDRVHIANGIARGRAADDVAVTSCTSGVLHLGKAANDSIRVQASLRFDSVLDNPSYFADPYAEPDGGDDPLDASGYVVGGLARAIDLSKTSADPQRQDGVVVWYLRSGGARPEKRLLFEDDGARIHTQSAAVLVAIDPAREGGRRRAWLFVTGFLARNMIAVKVDL